MFIAAMALGVLPLTGTPTLLSTNPVISAMIVGRVPATPAFRTIVLRFAFSNSSAQPVSLELCPNAMSVTHYNVQNSKAPKEVGADISYGMRTDDGALESGRCSQVELPANGVKTVDYLYRNLIVGNTVDPNANRVTLKSGSGSFTFVSNVDKRPERLVGWANLNSK